jgi:hypothetical protein
MTDGVAPDGLAPAPPIATNVDIEPDKSAIVIWIRSGGLGALVQNELWFWRLKSGRAVIVTAAWDFQGLEPLGLRAALSEWTGRRRVMMPYGGDA